VQNRLLEQKGLMLNKIMTGEKARYLLNGRQASQSISQPLIPPMPHLQLVRGDPKITQAAFPPGLNIHRQINACAAQGEGLYEVWAIYYWIIRIKSNRSPRPGRYISLLNCCSYSTFIVLAEAGQDVAVDTRATGAPPNVYRTSTFPTAFCAGWSELWRLWFIYTGGW
jgi:hypothetical protein